MTERFPVVAVVGRPNVGKSTLVNRIVGHRVAIVEERPGVTRDRIELGVDWAGRAFTVVDTGGWLDSRDGLERLVSNQVERAIAGADLIVVVADAVVGVTGGDEDVAAIVRRARVPVLLAANKVDGPAQVADAWALARLGLGDPVMVSALHGRGMGDFLDALIARLPGEAVGDEGAAGDGAAGEGAAGDGAAGKRPAGERTPGALSGGEQEPADRAQAGRSGEAPCPTDVPTDGRAEAELAVAIVGRPNVGKSTLFNRLAGDDRAVVHDEPGTTRDTVDTVITTGAGTIRLLDTAGMRRRARIDDPTEHYSVLRALGAVDAADVALLVIDATSGVTHQDQRLAERIDAAGSPIVVVCNKWELLDAEARAAVRAQVRDRLGFLGDSPEVNISALTGRGVHRLLPAIGNSVGAYRRRVPTHELNAAVMAAQAHHPAPGARVLYAVQGAVEPPTITLFTNRKVPATWLRYLENRLRADLGLGSTPIKIRVRLRGRG